MRLTLTTEDGRVVREWSSSPEQERTLPPAWAMRGASCPSNLAGSSLVSGIRRALEDGEVMERGGDPERPSERAMRLAWREEQR
jgi:hypothetical protein